MLPLRHFFALFRSLGIAVLLVLLVVSPALAKRKDDLVVLDNGDRITGEIKKVENGTLYFKPDYALDPIQIDWTRVAELRSQDRFNVALTSGLVHTGEIRKESAGDREQQDFSITHGATAFRFRRAEVITMRPMEDRLWKQLAGSVDYGFSFTSGNSQTQSSLGADVAYRGERNTVTANLSSTFSGQSNGTNTTRESLAAQYTRHLTERWSYLVSGELLSSSQQQLALRSTLGGGLARTMIRTDRTRFTAFGGLVASRERYSDDLAGAPRATNAEALMGLDFFSFRFRLFDLSSRLMAYPNLSTPGRIRLGSDSNLRWEFIRNLYWSLRIYENFDSRPPVDAPKNDFGVTTSFGWKF